MKYAIFLPLIGALLAFFVQTPTFFDPSLSQPVELGQVHWQRDLDRALQKAKDTEKDVLLLFQEVPG